MMPIGLPHFALFAGRTLAADLKVLKIGTTPDGHAQPVRGWNSFGTQAGGHLSDEDFNQNTVRHLCDHLASELKGNYKLCGLDSGWSLPENGDDHGRISYDPDRFDLPSFSEHLHRQGLLLGVYVDPGAFQEDSDKAIEGTNTFIRDICIDNNTLSRCNLNYTHRDTQKWFDSNAKLFASWGVDYIKLEFIRPGSPENGQTLPEDESGEVIAWHKAIENSGRDTTLAISWKLDRTRKYFDIWRANADSMRVDQDIQTYEEIPLTSWDLVIRILQNYMKWANTALSFYDEVEIHPNLNVMFVANEESLSGLNADQRKSVFIHWIGSSAELNLGDDLSRLDEEALTWLNDDDALSAADLTANFPMQPRNPGSGGNRWLAQNAWIAGPSDSGEFVVVLANYNTSGSVDITATWEDLGIAGGKSCVDVFEKTALESSTGLNASLQGGQSAMFRCVTA